MNAQVDAIAAALAFVERRLCTPITVADMAQAAGYSLFHFVRTFNAIVRHTPYDYLMRRRLSLAAQLLLQSDDRILDIALTCQFGSHEGFTRAFGRLFGIPPAAWREEGFCPPRCLMPALGLADLVFRSGPGFLPPERAQLKSLHLAGWMQRMGGQAECEAALVDDFQAAMAQDPIPMIDEDLWRVRLLPEAPGQLEIIFIGVRIDTQGCIPARYVSWAHEGGDCLRLQASRLSEDAAPAFTYLHHTFLPRSGLRTAAPVEWVHSGDPPLVYLPVVGE